MTSNEAKTNSLSDVYEFLRRLKEANIFYELSDPTGVLMVEISVPGERWEIEFPDDEPARVEVFVSRKGVEGPKTIDELFKRFSD
jgi:hypothetical protein